jgi:hypothetical protein
MPSLFKDTLTADEAAEALLLLMRKDFNKHRLSRLSAVSGLDLARAEHELIFLDFFAIYFSLKFTRSPGWRNKGVLVFEKLFGLLLSWWGTAWESNNRGTRDDVFKVFDGRLKVYGARIEEPASEDLDTMLRSIGETFAMYALTDETFYGADGRAREDRFLDVLKILSQDHDGIAIAVGSEAFNDRVQSLYGMFDQFAVK